jgi:molecular chaperone GrpE (heat shock protein)
MLPAKLAKANNLETQKKIYQLNMENSLKESLWKQFEASIDMLENAIILCRAKLEKTKNLFEVIVCR